MSLWDTSVLCVQQAFGLLDVTPFLYRWACRALAGRTVRKGLTGLWITPRVSGRAALRAAVSTAADVAVYAVARVLPVEGEVLLSMLVWAVAVALLLVNALSVPGPARRPLADRVAATSATGPGFSTAGATRPVRTS